MPHTTPVFNSSSSPSEKIGVEVSQSLHPDPVMRARMGGVSEHLLKVMEDIQNDVSPTHWITLTSEDSRAMEDLLKKARTIFSRYQRKFGSMRWVNLGSTNHGTSRAHIHAFVSAVNFQEEWVRRKWGLGRVDIVPYDPSQNGLLYSVQQLEPGCFDWSLESVSENAPARDKSSPPRSGKISNAERRLLRKRRQAQTDRDTVEKLIRKAQRSHLVPMTPGEVSWEPQSLELTARLTGTKALLLPITSCAGGSTAGWVPGPLGATDLSLGLITGLYYLPTVEVRDGVIGISRDRVAEWLKTTPPTPSGVRLAGRLASLVPSDQHILALVFTSIRNARLVRDRRTKRQWWLQLHKWSCDLHLKLWDITDPAAAEQVAKIGMREQLRLRGLGACVGCREARHSDARLDRIS